MIRTNSIVTAEQLRELYGEDEIPTHSCVKSPRGEWWLEPDGRWRFWKHPKSETPLRPRK